jgi:hypothetical protein
MNAESDSRALSAIEDLMQLLQLAEGTAQRNRWDRGVWAIAALAAIGITAAGLALVLLPVAFFAVWCLDALHSVKLIE